MYSSLNRSPGPVEPRTGPIERYYLSFNLYALGNGLVAVFLNLFFLSNYSYLAVLYFQIATYAVAYTAYALSGYALTRYSPKYLYLLGLALSVLVLADLLMAGGPLANAVAFGTVWGAAMGVFYAGNNPMMHDITRSADRTTFVATNNLLTGAVTLVAPVCAGALIQFSSFSGVDRYLWDFTVACGFFVFAAAAIVRSRQPAPRARAYSLWKTIRGPGPSYGRFQLLFVASQLFTIPFGIVLPIYVFERTGSYLLTGVFGSYVVGLSVVANFAFRRGFRREGRFATVAVLGIVLSSLLLLVDWESPLNAFVFAGLYTVLSTPLNNMVMVEFMEWIDRDGTADRVLVWANREFYLGVGRVIVLAVMIAIASYLVRNTTDLVFLLPFVSLYALAYLGIVTLPPGAHARIRGAAAVEPVPSPPLPVDLKVFGR